MFLETQVAQFRSAKQQEATRADGLAAQVPHQPDPLPCCQEQHILTCAQMNNAMHPATNCLKPPVQGIDGMGSTPHSLVYYSECACRWRGCRASWQLRSLTCRQPASRQRWQPSRDL